MEQNVEQFYGAARSLLYRVFAWMSVAVGISGLTALAIAQSRPALMQSPWAFFALFIVQLVIVIVLGQRIATLNYATAQLLFIIYSVASGATLSVIFLVYTTASITQVFFIAAGMFVSMALYGAYTKADLSQWRSLLMMMLWGMLIALIVNIFLKSAAFDFVLAVIGVVLFSLLTAYDIQNIQRMSAYLLARNEDFNKIALLGALQLYLDFVNLFLSLLRIFGKERQQ